MINCFIKDEMYGQGFLLSINCSQQECLNYAAKKYKTLIPKDDDSDGDAMYAVYETEQKRKVAILWMKHFKWDLSSNALLIHELQHVVYNNLKLVGIKHNDETDEVHAYYSQYLFTKIHEKLLKRKDIKNVQKHTGTRTKKRNKVLGKQKK